MKEKDLKQLRQELSKMYKLGTFKKETKEKEWAGVFVFCVLAIIALISKLNLILFIGFVGWLVYAIWASFSAKKHKKLAKELEKEGFELKK